MSAIAVAQFAPGPSAAANLEAMGVLANQAAQAGATLVVFPEYSSYFTPQPGPDWIAAAEDLDGAFAQGLAAIARRHSLTLVAGFLEAAGDKAHNTVIAVDATGSRVATYRKLHLYDAFGATESDWILPGRVGDELETFEWEGLTVGMQTCYDIRFPEVSRALVDRGADLVLVPAEWVNGELKERHWRALLTARAIENTVYIAAADHPTPIGVGNSMVIDPMGVELVTIGEGTGIAVADVTLQRVLEVRQTNPALRLRRFGVAPQ